MKKMKFTKKKNPTIADVLDVLQVFATKVDERFIKLEQEMKEFKAEFKEELEKVKIELRSEFRSELYPIKEELKALNARMDRLNKRTDEDMRAQGVTLLSLEKRVKVLEADFRLFRPHKKQISPA